MLRGAAILGFMLGFAAIGAAATVLQTPGVHIASQAAPSAAVMWLAPTPPPVARSSLAPGAVSPSAVVRSAPADQSGRAESKRHLDCGRNGELCEGSKGKQQPEGVTSDGKVILNIAGAEALTILPGVGKRRAEAILKLRERLGRFRRTSDLLRVRGIGVRSLKRMLPHLVLDPPKPEASPTPDPKAAKSENAKSEH
jgi:competence protein ComEA